MFRSTIRWTTGVAAAALIALPAAASAQQSGAPQQQPPQQQQQQQQPPPQTPPPAQAPPAQATPAQPAPAQPAAEQVDQAAAKQHLSEARDTLSQLTSMPEAGKLQGDTRTQVSQLISNFNELITTQSNWRASYDKVDANLTALLGPASPDTNAAASGTAGAVGTSGAAASPASATLDPAIRAKLTEFRSHLKLFEQAAGGRSAEARPGDTTGGMPPAAAAAAGSASNPAGAVNPGSAASNPDQARPVGTSGSSAAPTSAMNPDDQAKAADQVNRAEADKQLEAISSILEKSKTGALTRAQTTELKKHVAELRKLLQQGR